MHNTRQSIPDTSRLSCARWIRRLAAAGIAVAVAASTNLAAASANSETAPSVDPAVASYALEYSVTAQEAERRLDRIQPIQEILASIRDLEGSRLAGWGIDHSGTLKGWVWLTGNQPPTAGAASIANAHADVEIRTGATHSYAALLAAQDGLGAVGPTGRVNDNSGSDVWSIVTFTDIDLRDNGIEIGIDPALGMSVPGGLTDTVEPSVTDEALQAKATEVAGILQDHIPVRFAVVDGRGIADNATFMGGEEERTDTGACTSGFAARRRGRGSYGMITAGHCDGTMIMHDISLTFVSGGKGRRADARFDSIPTGSSHVLRGRFICSERGSTCDVTGDIARDRMLEDHVCHFGQSSGLSCGTVTSINIRPTWGYCRGRNPREWRCDPVFVRVEGPSLNGCRGDSGGPWYRGGTAYGIHKSSTGDEDCRRDGVTAYFSAIREAEDYTGTDIVTGPDVTIP